MSEERKLISCHFGTEEQLYAAYMPFVKGGGLFIRTKQHVQLGALVSLNVELLNDTETYEVDGKVVWLTPSGAQGNKPAGIGVQFEDGNPAREFVRKIETHLAGILKSAQSTDTL